MKNGQSIRKEAAEEWAELGKTRSFLKRLHKLTKSRTIRKMISSFCSEIDRRRNKWKKYL